MLEWVGRVFGFVSKSKFDLLQAQHESHARYHDAMVNLYIDSISTLKAEAQAYSTMLKQQEEKISYLENLIFTEHGLITQSNPQEPPSMQSLKPRRSSWMYHKASLEQQHKRKDFDPESHWREKGAVPVGENHAD